MKRALAAPRGALCRAAFGASVLLTASAAVARDAQRVQRLLLGSSGAFAASEGLDARNGYRSRSPFPKSTTLSLRTRLSGGIGQAPASDESGNLIIAHSEPRLSKLDPQGRTLWTERLPSEASGPPVILADGSILIVTREAEALLFSGAGRQLQKTPLPFADSRRRTLAIASASGGAWVASGSELVELDGAIAVHRQARLRGNASALLESGASLFAVSESGNVERARASGDLELVGSFGGNLSDGATLRAAKVWALVDGHRLLALDLASGLVSTVAVDPTATLSGPLASLGPRGIALVADGSFVSERDGNGVETLRVAIASPSAGFESPARGGRARLVSDAQGAVVAVQAGYDALLLSRDGSVVRFAGTSCLDPLRPTPTANAVYFSCRSGQLFGLSDPAP